MSKHAPDKTHVMQHIFSSSEIEEMWLKLLHTPHNMTFFLGKLQKVSCYRCWCVVVFLEKELLKCKACRPMWRMSGSDVHVTMTPKRDRQRVQACGKSNCQPFNHYFFNTLPIAFTPIN